MTDRLQRALAKALGPKIKNENQPQPATTWEAAAEQRIRQLETDLSTVNARLWASILIMASAAIVHWVSGR